MNIAIFGAGSQISKDLILSFFCKNKDFKLFLFSRRTHILEKWIVKFGITENFKFQEYDGFGKNYKYDVIINFIGAVSPKSIQDVGQSIFTITEKYDQMIIDYLNVNKRTKYIFLSSGSIFGDDYKQPVRDASVAKIDINNMGQTCWYPMSKLYAESKHRALSNLFIVDVRVFNYFSKTMSIDSGYLITDIARSIKNKEVFLTSKYNIVRDYIGPNDFYNLIMSLISVKNLNMAIDCYTKAPVDKVTLLNNLKNKFGLEYVFKSDFDTINATGYKKNYFSKSRKAINFGYKPTMSSLETIISELDGFLSI